MLEAHPSRCHYWRILKHKSQRGSALFPCRTNCWCYKSSSGISAQYQKKKIKKKNGAPIFLKGVLTSRCSKNDWQPWHLIFAAELEAFPSVVSRTEMQSFTSNHLAWWGWVPSAAPQILGSVQRFLQCKAHFHHAQLSHKVFYHSAVKTRLKIQHFNYFSDCWDLWSIQFPLHLSAWEITHFMGLIFNYCCWNFCRTVAGEQLSTLQTICILYISFYKQK